MFIVPIILFRIKYKTNVFLSSSKFKTYHRLYYIEKKSSSTFYLIIFKFIIHRYNTFKIIYSAFVKINLKSLACYKFQNRNIYILRHKVKGLIENN